jgi:hypothetical protein
MANYLTPTVVQVCRRPGRETMIVEVTTPRRSAQQRKPVLVIDWDRVGPPWNELAPEIAEALHELARRGAGWASVKTDGEEGRQS